MTASRKRKNSGSIGQQQQQQQKPLPQHSVQEVAAQGEDVAAVDDAIQVEVGEGGSATRDPSLSAAATATAANTSTALQATTTTEAPSSSPSLPVKTDEAAEIKEEPAEANKSTSDSIQPSTSTSYSATATATTTTTTTTTTSSAALQQARIMARSHRQANKSPIAVVIDQSLVPSLTPTRTLDPVIYTGAYPLKPYSTRPSDLSLFLLPRFTRADHGAHINVGVPAELLCWSNNPGLQANAVWGTDVYTDDSDIVAMIVHAGFYLPGDLPEGGCIALTNSSKLLENNNLSEANSNITTDSDTNNNNNSMSIDSAPIPVTRALVGDHNATESCLVFPSSSPSSDEASKNNTTTATTSSSSGDKNIPSAIQIKSTSGTSQTLVPSFPRPHICLTGKLVDTAVSASSTNTTNGVSSIAAPASANHDLEVTLAILPRLARYTGCIRYAMASRGWGGGHDGESVVVVRVRRVERGTWRNILKQQGKIKS